MPKKVACITVANSIQYDEQLQKKASRILFHEVDSLKAVEIYGSETESPQLWKQKYTFGTEMAIENTIRAGAVCFLKILKKSTNLHRRFEDTINTGPLCKNVSKPRKVSGTLPTDLPYNWSQILGFN